MALDSIHVWADAEVITHTDLNSIGNGVSNEVGSGNILPSSIVWPLVALGDIDMNGYSIINNAQTFGVYHVNEDQTLAAAVNEVNTNGGGVIVIDPGFNATAADLTISAPNVSIVGDSKSSIITVSGSIVSHGIKWTQGGGLLAGVKVNGGKSGLPCIHLGGVYDNNIYGCIFNAPTGIAVKVGDSNTAVQNSIKNNNFATHAEEAIFIERASKCLISGNKFVSGAGNDIHLPGDTEATGVCQGCIITDNTFVLSTGLNLYASWTGGDTANRGYLTVSRNVFSASGVGECVSVTGYYLSRFSDNEFFNDSVLGLSRCIVSGNSFAGEIDFDNFATMITNNRFSDPVNISTARGGVNMYTNNWFSRAFEANGADAYIFNSNLGANGFTLNATVPDIYGLNWGL